MLKEKIESNLCYGIHFRGPSLSAEKFKIIQLSFNSRAPWPCGLMRHVLDREDGGSNLGATFSFGDDWKKEGFFGRLEKRRHLGRLEKRRLLES